MDDNIKNEENEIKKEANTEEINETSINNTSETKEEKATKKIKEKCKKIDKEKEQLRIANLDLKEKVLRITAEMQNMKRRYELDMANFYKYEGFDLIEKILPVLDNFERAMNTKIEGAEKYLSGFKMIYDNLVSILEAKGVKEIEVIDKEFDPNIMHAVLTEENKEKENNIVLECLQKGYMYNDKLIRPAMVKVNERND